MEKRQFYQLTNGAVFDIAELSAIVRTGINQNAMVLRSAPGMLINLEQADMNQLKEILQPYVFKGEEVKTRLEISND